MVELIFGAAGSLLILVVLVDVFGTTLLLSGGGPFTTCSLSIRPRLHVPRISAPPGQGSWGTC
jgi:hypothetical protein